MGPPTGPKLVEGRKGVAKNRRPPAEVFLNVPYDRKFENLFLAYVAGVSAFGLTPRATLEIRNSKRRLEKIVELIAQCRYSIHDLSRVELDQSAPKTPRFNMPFELGLAVGHEMSANGRDHRWFVCEAKGQRLLKSLSDLNGTDPHIHDGTIVGVFRELRNIFTRPGRQPTVQEMARVYRQVRRSVPSVLHKSGSDSLYNATVFKDLVFVAGTAAERVLVESR